MSRSLLLILLLLPTMNVGCVVLFTLVPRHVPDPRAKDYVKVESVSGRMVTLANGRKHELLGVDLSRVSEPTAKQYERRLKEMLQDHHALVLEEKDGKARLVIGGGPEVYRHTVSNIEYPILIPIYYDDPPPRTDIAVELLKWGVAECRPADVSDLWARAEYKKAQAQAQQRCLGVWHYRLKGIGLLNSLGWAILNNDLAEATYILERCPDRPTPEDLGRCLLWMAGDGRTEGVRLLLDHGANIEWQDELGGTPLMQAVNYSHGGLPIPGHAEVVRLLLARGANVNHARKDGLTALRWARRNENAEIIRILLDAGADPKPPTKPDQTQ